MTNWFLLHPETGVSVGAIDAVYTGDTLPTASETYHRAIFILEEDDGAETVYICIKDAGDTYGWQFIGGGKGN